MSDKETALASTPELPSRSKKPKKVKSDKDKEKKKEGGGERKKKNKKDKDNNGKDTTKKKKKKKVARIDSEIQIGTNKRITIVYPSADNPTNRKLVRLPGSWKALTELCEELLEGQKLGKICSPQELGGGDVESIDLIENGDVIHIFPFTGGGPRSKRGGIKSGPRSGPRSTSSDDAPSSAERAISSRSRSYISNSARRDDLMSESIFSLAGDILGGNEDVSLRTIYHYVRHVPVAYKGASIASGPVYFAGFYMAAYEAAFNEHTTWLGGLDGLHRRTEKDQMKEEDKYAAKLKALTPTWKTVSDNEFLEKFKIFEPNTNFLDVACGLNMVAAVTAEKKLLLSGPAELNHVLLTRPKPFEGAELKNLQDKKIIAFPANNVRGQIKGVACGAFHCGAYTSDNNLYLWGFNINCSVLGIKGEEVKKQMSSPTPKYTISGQLGLGEASTKLIAMPVKVEGLTGTIQQIALGGAHTMCLTTTGVWSWGLNDEGQLGHQENRFVPTLIRGLSGYKIKKIACGAHHSAAVSGEGQLFTWGYNEYGQLGTDESRRTVFEPILIRKFELGKDNDGVAPIAISVSCGSGHTAMVDQQGRVFTCGSNEFGQLGRRDKKFKTFVMCSLPDDTAEAVDVRCGSSSTAVVTGAGLVLVCGHSMGPRFMCHTAEFRSIPDLEKKDVFISNAYVGQTHVAIQEDVRLTETLKLFKRACSYGDFAKEDIKHAMLTVAPFFVKSIQDRAVLSLHLENEDSPYIMLRRNFVEFRQQNNTQELAIKNLGKKKVSISFDLKSLEFPETCKLTLDPPEGIAKPGKSLKIKAQLDGAATQDINTMFVINAIAEKGKAPLQLFVHVVVPALSLNDVEGTGESKLANYAKQHLAAVVARRDEEKKKAEREDSKDMFSNIDFANCEVVLFERLGSGGSGAVVNRCTANGLSCAVKSLDTRQTNKRTVDGFIREISIMEGLRHPCIVRFLGHDVTINSIRLFMEFYPHSLVTIIKKYQRVKKIPAREIVNIGIKIAEGIEYLHRLDPPIVHRDIKPGNVLVALDEQDVVKLCKITDFDVSREILPGQQALTICGTPQYSAPEMMFGGKTGYDLSVDIYSFGMVLYELMTLTTPYDGEDSRTVANKIKDGILPTMSTEVKNNSDYLPLLEVYELCTLYEPNQRPSASDLVIMLKNAIKKVK